MDFKKILGSIPFLAKKTDGGIEQTPPVEQVILQNGDNAVKSKQSRIVIIAGAMAIVVMGLAVGYMLVPKAEDNPLSQPLSKGPVPVGNLDKSMLLTPAAPTAATAAAIGATDNKPQGAQDGQAGVQIPSPANTQAGGVQQAQTQPASTQEHTPKTGVMGNPPASQPSHRASLNNPVNDAAPLSKKSREAGRVVSEDSGVVPEQDPFKKEFLKKFKNDAAKEKLAASSAENKNLKSLEETIKKAQQQPVALSQAVPPPPPPIKRELEISVSGVVISSADTYAVSDKGVVRVGDPVGTYIIERITADIVQLKHMEDPKDIKVVNVGGNLKHKDKQDQSVRSAPFAPFAPSAQSPNNNASTPASVFAQPRLMPY